RKPWGHSLQAPHDPLFGFGVLERKLGAPPLLRVGGLGQTSEMFLARGASFHMLREGVPFGRAQSVRQQAWEFLAGGTERHVRAPGASGMKERCSTLRDAGYMPVAKKGSDP